MNTQHISDRLRNHQRQDLAIKEAFLRFQAHHFETTWQELLELFIEKEGQVELFGEPFDVSAEILAFLSQEEQSFDGLQSYTKQFAQAGLNKLPQLSSVEKDWVVDVATYNLAVRFQLLDSYGTYQGVSLASLLAEIEKVNLINVSKVANNLAARIARDLDQFILYYEPPQVIEPRLRFEEDEAGIIAVYNEPVARFDKSSFLTEHLPAYGNLNLAIKADIIAHFDQQKAELKHLKEKDLAISFETVGDDVFAYAGTDLVSQYELGFGRSKHKTSYYDLPLEQQFNILSHYDKLRQEITLPRFRLGEFDTEKELTPVYEGDKILTYFEANGAPGDLARELTASETAEMVVLSRELLLQNAMIVAEAGVPYEEFSDKNKDILLDAAGRFHLTQEQLAFLGKYPQAKMTSLAMTVDLLSEGLPLERASDFIESDLSHDDLLFLARLVMSNELSSEIFKTYEVLRETNPDKEAKILLDEANSQTRAVEAERRLQEFFEQAQALYPLGSLVTYNDTVFKVIAVDKDDNQVRLELINDARGYLELNPVLYVSSMSDLEGRVVPYLPEEPQPVIQAKVQETTFDDSLSELKEQVHRIYPLGSLSHYGSHLFEVAGIWEDQGRIRAELAALPDDDVRHSPVFYVGSLDALEKSQLVYRPENISPISVESEMAKTGNIDELDLFSFLDDNSTESLSDQEVEEKVEPVVDQGNDEVIEASLNQNPTQNEPVVVDQEPKQASLEPADDFVFPDDLTAFYPKGTRAKIEANLAAISLVKELEKHGRQASFEEQEVLAKYVGWGGLANNFFDEYNSTYAVERDQLRELVSDMEYSDMKQSSLTAYYTDPAIIRAMWEKLEADGFSGGRVLDPSMGTGNFFAAMPPHLKVKSELYGVELDGTTGAIAKQLHPNARIFVQGFEEVPFQPDSFDLVISNIPFGNFRIADNRYDKPYMIHDYFIKKSLDVVHDGGQVVVISSIGSMDKRVDNVLHDIKDTTTFLGGVRLPDTAFKAIAGTNVTSDILFFQKALVKDYNQDDLAFSGAVRFSEDDRIWLNPYFDGSNNSQVLGTYAVRNFNGGTLTVKGDPEELLPAIRQAFEQVSAPTIKPDVFINPQVLAEKVVDQSVPATIAETLDLYSFGYVGDTIYYRDRDGIRVGSKTEEISYYVHQDGTFEAFDSKHSPATVESFLAMNLSDDEAIDVYLSNEPSKSGRYKGLYKKTVFYEGLLSEKEVARIKGMVDIRDTYQAMIDLQRDYNYDQQEFALLLADLNHLYDRFVKKHGYLNASVNRNLFDSDDKYSLLASLEDEYIDPVDKKVKYKKSLAFEKALVRPEKVLSRVTTAQDALNASLAEGRGVDFPFMLSLYSDTSEEELIKELGELILLAPDEALRGNRLYVSRQEFLSGDIIDKLDQVDLLAKQENPWVDWRHYQDLLEAVRPPRIGLADIAYRIGSRWIPQEVYGQFAFETFLGKELAFDDDRLFEVINESQVDGSFHLQNQFLKFYVTAKEEALGVSGSRYNNGRKIFENLLNSNQPTITKAIVEDGKQKYVTDVEKTALLRSKEADLQDLFKKYVEGSSEAQVRIENAYNNLFNRTVSKAYDGTNLTIDGLAKNIALRPHQRHAIQRIVEEKRALLAHEVGSGKTLTMLGAGFKLKELGMVHKPLYVVPSSLTAQFGQEILKFFPTKKVFVTTKKDFAKAKRKQFVSRIITGDYDAIVIGDSQFEKIPMSRESQVAFIIDKLDELREIYSSSENSYTVKESERAIKGLEERLEKLQKIDQDTFIDFENLGIDCLFVDEAHHFKNIRPVTGLGNVAGITNITAKKNIDMEMKVRHIQSEHDNRNIIFATGTPVSNSISELYTMMSYVQPDVLDRYQVSHFDSWVGTFGLIENSMELAPTGDKYQPKKRFKKFVNLPELMRMYRETADIQTSDMLDLPVPEARIIPVESELTENQKLYLEELVERSEAIKSGQVDPSKDNMLKITGEARKLAIDMRLIDPYYKLSDNQKILQVVDNVERIYRENMATESTQMIFSDIGTPKKDGETFDIYNEIKSLLIDRGIPASQIAFVHDANTDDKRNSLSRQVNSGEVRVLMASTEKGGTGLNVQAKMKAVHHLDVPWRPSDIVRASVKAV